MVDGNYNRRQIDEEKTNDFSLHVDSGGGDT